MGGHSIFVARLAEAYLLAARVKDATQLAGRALELARAQKERGHEAYALRLLGEIASQRGAPDHGNAEAYYRQALALAEELGMRPLLAHCHAGLASLYRRTGRRADAERHSALATALFGEMDMRLWLEQVPGD
jgi:tetratricopeptide (TPR) repeat protein